MKFLLTENKKLRDVLESDTTKNYSSIVARVMIDKESPFLKSIIINKGSRAKIKKGMPVVKGNYLIGRVVEVNYMSSRVLLLNDLNSRIPVLISKSGAQAILIGKGGISPELTYLPELYEPFQDQIVYTSGKDGLFSEGIAIGTTTVINRKISVKLLADPNQLSYVNVIFDKNSKEENF